MVRKYLKADIAAEAIAKKIFEARLELGWSRQELAEKIGVTHQQLQKYENCKNKISAGRLMLIAKATNKPINFFYQTELLSMTNNRVTLEVFRNLMKCTIEQQTIVNNIIKELLKVSFSPSVISKAV